MAIKAVIFDLGGVLIRTEDHGPREALAHKYGLTRQQLETIVFGGGTPEDSGNRAQVGEITTEEHWVNVCRALGLEPDDSRAFQAGFWGGDRPDEELVDYIRELKRKYTTALLSNAFDDLRDALTREWEIIDAFDVVVISAEVGIAKPDRRVYDLVIERLGVEPQEAVFVDDFQHNVEGARAAGLHAIRFRDPQQVRADLEALLNSKEHTT